MKAWKCFKIRIFNILSIFRKNGNQLAAICTQTLEVSIKHKLSIQCMGRNFLFVHFTTQLKNLILLVALQLLSALKSFKIFKCSVNRYTRTNLIWKSSVRDFCFESFSVHHATPFSTKEVSFFVFELFQKYSASKDYFGL